MENLTNWLWFSVVYTLLYHAIENTANQNAGKPLNIVSIPLNLPIDHYNSTVSQPTFPSCVENPASFFEPLFEPFEPRQSQIFHSASILRSETIICNLVMNYS